MAARAAWNAFFQSPDTTTDNSADRIARYSWAWEVYNNTAYDNLASYARYYPPPTRLYRYMRGLKNPVGRYVDFYVANIWGGVLDNSAGGDTDTALPIETDNDNLRAAIARVWAWSNWGTKRQLTTLQSTVLGDAFLRVVDRPASQRVYLSALWPGHVKALEWDDYGFVKRLEIEYTAEDAHGRSYTYSEVIEHPRVWGGDTVRFSTYKNNQPFAYDANRDTSGAAVWQWTAPYDFVPVVHIPWRDVGGGWGVTGWQRAMRKVDAANSLASLLADQVGKAVNTPLVAYGIQAGDVTATSNEDGVPVLYVNRPPSEAQVQPLVGDLNLDHGLALLVDQSAEIASDLPELRMAEALRSGMSGEALGRAFSDVIANVQFVRAGHDAALVRAQQMAVTIGAIGRYHPAFETFDAASFPRGALDHNIGPRAVLPAGSGEATIEEQARWQMVNSAVSNGVPLETALREIVGWDDDKLAAMQADAQRALWVDNEP